MASKYFDSSKKQIINQSNTSNGKFKGSAAGSTRSARNSAQQLKNKRKQQSQNQDSDDEEAEEFLSFTIERDVDPDELEDPENYFEQLSMSFYNSHKKGDLETRRLIEESLKAFVLGHQKDMMQQQRGLNSRKGGKIVKEQRKKQKVWEVNKRGMNRKEMEEEKVEDMMMLIGRR